ncbi:MAG TPA: hypothetical protein ENJ64_05310, partial [Thiotrichales bacterium]|nr:hypothetical protein [Thiotrichales bacterium]
MEQRRRTMNKVLRLLMVAFVFVAGQAWAIEITKVYHQPAVIWPEKGEQVSIHFSLSAPAAVTLRVYDDRDILIASTSRAELPAGEHRLNWDGRDMAQRLVPAEAYHYTLTAKTRDGEMVTHDITDYTGGDRIRIKDISWNADKHQF